MSNVLTPSLRMAQLLKIVPLSRSHIYALIKVGEFPKPFKLSTRASAWDAEEVQRFLAARKQAI
jgi:prophage regulatory protein